MKTRAPRWYDGLQLFWNRQIVYRLVRPRSPRYPERLRGPALVVGSAPVSNLPAGFDDSFTVITINGSQAVTQGWGIEAPHATFMQYSQVEGSNPNALAVRRVLSGQRTGVLYLIRWTKGMDRLKEGLAAFGYGYADLHALSRYHRMSLHEDVMGFLNPEYDVDSRFSNGITAVLYAFNSGASAVIITGIDPGSAGHVYNELGIRRMHASHDREMLLALRSRGFPIFTSDPHVAASLGIPLWTALSG